MLKCSLAPPREGSHDQVSVHQHESQCDERQGGQRAREQQACGDGEEGGRADAEQGRDVAEVEEAARGGEEGEEDKIAQAEAEPEGRAEGREDEQQEVKERGVRPHERLGRPREDAENIRGYRRDHDYEDRAYRGYVAGERDADAGSGEYPSQVGDTKREQDQKPRSIAE